MDVNIILLFKYTIYILKNSRRIYFMGLLWDRAQWDMEEKRRKEAEMGNVPFILHIFTYFSM